MFFASKRRVDPPQLPAHNTHQHASSRKHADAFSFSIDLFLHSVSHPHAAVIHNKLNLPLNDACSAAISKRDCKHYFKQERLVQAFGQLNVSDSAGGVSGGGNGHSQNSVWDIEDLVDMGRRKRACPYFASKDLAKQADIIFCPYSYVVQPGESGFRFV